MDYSSAGLHIGIIIDDEQRALTGATIFTLPSTDTYAIDRTGNSLSGFTYTLPENGETLEFGGFLVATKGTSPQRIAIYGSNENKSFEPLTILLAPNQISYGIHSAK